MLSTGVDNFYVNYKKVILNSVILPEFYNTEVNQTINEAKQLSEIKLLPRVYKQKDKPKHTSSVRVNPMESSWT